MGPILNQAGKKVELTVINEQFEPGCNAVFPGAIDLQPPDTEAEEAGDQTYEEVSKLKNMILCMGIIFIIIPVYSVAAGMSGPGMIIPDPVFDAGKIDQGTTVRHEFIVKNPGDEPLHIIKVNTD